MTIRTRPPTWFWIVAIVLVLWGVAACGSYVAHIRFDPDDPANPAYDRQLYKSVPQWLNWVYGFAVGTVMAGAIALLFRVKEAVFLYAASAIATVIQFGWTLGATDLIAVKGVGIAVGPPVVIVLIGFAAWWFAMQARRRGWIG